MFRKTMILGFAGFAAMLLAPAPLLHAQDGPPAGGGGRRGGGQFAGMQRVSGEVTAISGATLTIKTEEGGSAQIVTTDNTRVTKGSGGPGGGEPAMTPVKVSDLKVGDGVTAMGNLDAPNKTLHAAVIVAVDAAQIKAARANWGKTYIAGKVTAVDLDNARMTVQRPDGVSLSIGFDESTSFKRGRVNINEMGGVGGGFGAGGGRGGRPGAGANPPQGESITLADIKVGDEVAGQGSVKAGVFTPGELTVATPGQGRRRGPGGPPGEATPSATPPTQL